MKVRRGGFLLRVFCVLVVVLSKTGVSAQGFAIHETLRDAEAPSFDFGGSNRFPDIKAYLTAGDKTSGDKVGDGWLRLTEAEIFQAGYAVVRQSFPSKLGVLIDLEYKIWRDKSEKIYTGADGFSIFLFDAKAYKNFHIGGFGGSLGYAPHILEDSIGLSGGFVGIGIDEFGNYSNPTEGRTGGVGFQPNSIGVRGPQPNYAWLTGNTALTNLFFQYEKGYSAKRPSDSVYYRRIQIEITPISESKSNQYSILVRMKNAIDGKFTRILDPYTLPTTPPDTLMLGFAASTGADLNYHELRNLFITTPGGVRLTKQVDKSVANINDELTYTIDLYNQTEDVLSGLKLSDPFSQFPAQFQVEEVTFNNDGDTINTATGYSLTDMSNVTVSLNAFSHASFTIKGTVVALPPNGLITNTAVFNAGTSGIFDPDKSNDTSTVTTSVRQRDLFIPNVYTPNGDGHNDVFRIRGLEEYPNSQLIINNRWGNQVYFSDDYQNDWNGDGLNEGTYYYFLTVERYGVRAVYKGWVLLKR